MSVSGPFSAPIGTRPRMLPRMKFSPCVIWYCSTTALIGDCVVTP
jgi:hypothetical protein